MTRYSILAAVMLAVVAAVGVTAYVLWDGSPTTASGLPALVTITAGTVGCETARAIVTRYNRDVQTQGTGGGGFLKVDDWSCISRTAADQERDGSYGHCGRGDDTLEMSRP
jgi:hypothetical protein